MVEHQHDLKIKVIQMGGGKEDTTFYKVLNDHGITHRISYPHTHEHNWSTKRNHKHITKVDHMLVANVYMLFSYWGKSFKTIAIIINRLPIPLLNYSSPLQILFYKDPNYHAFKIFGCPCFPYFRPYNKHRFNFTYEQSVFLGYIPNHKA